MNLNWGMIGLGAIAPAFVVAVKSSKTGKLLAVASRDLAKSKKFADEHGVPVAYGSYEQLLGDPSIDAVYVSLPHTLHAQWTIAALEAGKHVLCEKPFAVNHREALRMFEVARQRRLMVMEAFMYRCHPQTAKVVELLKQKVIGDIRLIQGSFSYHNAFDPSNRVYQNDMAGGAILELGGYPVSYSRLIAGVALGQDFAEPLDIKASGYVGQTGVDEQTVANLEFPNNIIAQVAACLSVNQDNVVRIFGSKGQIALPHPFVSNRQEAAQGKIIVQMEWQAPTTIDVPADRTSFSYEVDVFANAIADGTFKPAYPAATRDDTLGNMRALDLWRARIGCVYPQDKAQM